jgi:acyl CoA:acetate/3-ketoacid CoA transferase alpha subunit
MAMAANHVIVETEILTEPGGLSAEAIHTPAPFVDRLVNLPELTEDYGVIRR